METAAAVPISQPKIKVNWFHVILAAFLPAAIELIWLMYNTYVPVFMQVGNPNFKAGNLAVAVGFGLGPALTGLILTFDNIAGLFISPLVGMWSDTIRTRFGRRMPFIITTAPIAAIALIAIPYLHAAIPPELSGQTAQLTGLLVPFVIALFLVLVPLAIFRTPADTLLFDITPSRHRTTAFGIAVLVGGLTVAAGAIGGSSLYDLSPTLPFWVAGGLCLLLIVLAFIFVKEPEETIEKAHREVSNLKTIFSTLGGLPAENRRSLVLLALSTFFGFTGLGQVQAFLSSWAVTVLKVEVSQAANLQAVSALALMFVAVPVALLANRIGRRTTTIAGYALIGLASLALFFTSQSGMAMLLIAVAGMSWAMVNVNIEPMMIDAAGTDSVLGTIVGLRQLVVTLGFIVGPILGGAIAQAAGSDYRWLWPEMALFFFLGLAVMLPVKMGEARNATE